MKVDFIVFGHGHDGVLRTDDYNGSGVVEFLPAAKLQAINPGKPIIPQQARFEKFQVMVHTSGLDRKRYFLAVADGYIPEDIDVKIMQESPRPIPEIR